MKRLRRRLRVLIADMDRRQAATHQQINTINTRMTGGAPAAPGSVISLDDALAHISGSSH